MNIVFLSESNIRGKVERTFENSRTEFGWSIALDAEWLPITENTTKKYDLGIVIIPKNNPNVDLDRIRNFCDKVGPHWYFQDYEIDKQFNYYNTLMSADWVYCHNYSDTKYYKGLGCKDVRIMRSLMIPDGIQPRSDWGDVTMIGGNFVSWYGGFDSYIVAREIGDPISCPSMGRKQQQEDLIDDINYLPYMSWREWIHTLGQFNIGIHLMRTHAAGTFAMNCAFHGIPCIGYYGLDTQEILHPLLTVELGDLKRAVKLAKKLKKDKDFYNDCSSVARDRYLNQYSEEVWLKKWRDENETN